MRGRLQMTLALLAGIGAVALASIAVFGGAAGQGAGSTVDALMGASSPQAAASDFGTAYLGVLAGTSRAARLPLSTAAVQQTAAGTTISRSHRSGIVSLDYAHINSEAGTRANAVLIARDGAHSFPFAIAMTRTSAGWIVSGLQVPDLSQIFASPAPKPAAAPAGARRLAERLAKGAPLSVGQLQHGILPIQVGTRNLLLKQVGGRWILWDSIS